VAGITDAVGEQVLAMVRSCVMRTASSRPS
jgi:hypothetical protein